MTHDILVLSHQRCCRLSPSSSSTINDYPLFVFFAFIHSLSSLKYIPVLFEKYRDFLSLNHAILSNPNEMWREDPAWSDECMTIRLSALLSYRLLLAQRSHNMCHDECVFFLRMKCVLFFSENIVWSSFVSLSQFVSYVRIGKTWVSARSSGVYICVQQWSVIISVKWFEHNFFW